MNCAEWQEKIALFTGADLPEDEAAAVEAHLAGCEECRAFDQEISNVRAELLSLRTVDDAELVRLRSNVIGQLSTRRRFNVAMLLPYAAVVAMLVFGWTLWRPAVGPPPPYAAQVQPPAMAFVRGVKNTEAAKPVRPARREARKAAPAEEPTVVTLYTDDPDVVIVWITD
jgi:anti-sigma factor RsiW